MKATLLLCDWAEVVAGKLYAQGIGWSLTQANNPQNASAVAMLLYVPYDMTNRKTSVKCSLLTADGQPYPDETPASFGFEFEIGRPPGLKPGTDQIVPFAAKLGGIAFLPGGYEWQLEVNGDPIASETFTAIDTPAPPGAAPFGR